MSNQFFASVKKVVRESIRGVHSTTIENADTPHSVVEIQQLIAEECMAVSGGPQIQNEPD
jgi:hypothetical protein